MVDSGSNEERLQPLLVLGGDDIGCSESREEGNTRYFRFIGAPMTETRVLHSGITGPCCSSKQFGGLPSSPSWPDHRPQLPAPKGTARRPRGTVRRRTADGMALRLFGMPRKWRTEQSKRGQGRQPRMEEDRRLTGVPACRNRVAEIGSKNRGSEKRGDVPLPEWKSFFAWAGARPRGDNLGLCVARRTSPSASSDRAMFHRTNPLQLVGLTG